MARRVCPISGPIFHCLWTKVREIISPWARETVVCNASFRLLQYFGILLVSFQTYWQSQSKVVRNCAKFWVFLVPPNFRREGPKFWDLVVKIALISDQMTKFCSTRPRDLGEYMLKKRINIISKTQWHNGHHKLLNSHCLTTGSG